MMRSLLAGAALVALVACGSGEAEEEVEISAMDPVRAEQEVRQANARYDRALVASDAAALEELLASDYVYITAAGEVRDRATTIARHSGGGFSLQSEGSDQVRVRWFGEHALVTGRFRAQVTSGGATFPVEERYTALWSKGRDGRWRLHHEHASQAPRHP